MRPRVYTPPLRPLDRDTSLGFEVCDFAEQAMGLELLEWQRWLLVHALEVTGSLSGSWRFRFRTVVVLVARQNGKTFLGKVLASYFLYALGAPVVLGTAQSVAQAEDTWEATVSEVEGNAMLSPDVAHIWRTNGSKCLALTGNRKYKVRAATRRATRGMSCDLVLFDELREQQDYEAWAAVAPTTKARPNSVKWCMSNAGDGTSVVLRNLRMGAHAAIGDPDGIVAALASSALPDEGDPGTVGLFEWSAEPDADGADRAQWALANPSLGCGFLDEQAIADDLASFDADKFRQEDLCQWVTAAVTAPFPEGAWEAGTDPDSRRAPDSEPVFGVDVSADRSRSSICVVAARPDGRWHGELVAYRPGTAWLKDWFAERAGDGRRLRVGLQASGAPVSAYADILAAIDGVEVSECGGRDVAAWCGRLWDAVDACANDDNDAAPIMHRPQPALDLAANVAATRPMGDGAWAFDRHRSLEDASPLVALAMAFGAATSVAEAPPASAYDDHPLLFV